MSHRTSTFVFGFKAIPAFMPLSCMYLISSFGLVFFSECSSGLSAAVEERAAS